MGFIAVPIEEFTKIAQEMKIGTMNIKDEFLAFVSKFSTEVSDSIQSMTPG